MRVVLDQIRLRQILAVYFVLLAKKRSKPQHSFIGTAKDDKTWDGKNQKDTQTQSRMWPSQFWVFLSPFSPTWCFGQFSIVVGKETGLVLTPVDWDRKVSAIIFQSLRDIFWSIHLSHWALHSSRVYFIMLDVSYRGVLSSLFESRFFHWNSVLNTV